MEYNYIEIRESQFEKINLSGEPGLLFRIPVGGPGLLAKRITIRAGQTDSAYMVLFQNFSQFKQVRETQLRTPLYVNNPSISINNADHYIYNETVNMNDFKVMLLGKGNIATDKHITALPGTCLDQSLILYTVAYVPFTVAALSYEIIYEVED